MGAAALNCQAGVDEAGLGPLVGPLVVAGVALRPPRGGEPWSLLRDVVCQDTAEKGKIQVADSKKVHAGKEAFERLELTALCFWDAWQGRRPETVAQLLETARIDTGRLAACPWYRRLDEPLPLRVDRRLLDLQTHLLRKELLRRRVAVEHVALRAVEAEEFNQLIATTGNKSHAHFTAYSDVMGQVLARLPRHGHLLADRCGGLVYYLPSLERAYPGSRIVTVRESAERSTYRIERPHGSVRVTFAVGGEALAFPTALASCLAKYVREVMLSLLNRWFRERIPTLRPTAGYYGDGRRFLNEVLPLVQREGLRADLLQRCR